MVWVLQFCGRGGWQVIPVSYTHLDVYKRQQKCLEFVKSEKRAKSVICEDFNGSPAKLPKNKADRLLIFLRGTSAEGAQAHIFSAARNLKPNGIGYWFDFFIPEGVQIGDKYSACLLYTSRCV